MQNPYEAPKSNIQTPNEITADDKNLKTANIYKRIGGVLMDVLICYTAIYIIDIFIDFGRFFVPVFASYFIYALIITQLKQSTIGQNIVRSKLILAGHDHLKKPTFLQNLLRLSPLAVIALLVFFSSNMVTIVIAVTIIGYVICNWSTMDKQPLWDKIIGTRIITVPENYGNYLMSE